MQSPFELILAHQQRLDEMNGVCEGKEPRNALEYCQDVYKGRRAADPSRMRAAMAALPFETPKLIATALMTNADFGALLDKAILRSNGAKIIDHQPEPDANRD
jgi:hypothetical protein